MTAKLYSLSATAKVLGLTGSYLWAIKVAMGKAGARFLEPEEVKAWLLAHPEFRRHQVKNGLWHRPQREDQKPVYAGKSDERLPIRGLRSALLEAQAGPNGRI
jgi:hypothetical protein